MAHFSIAIIKRKAKDYSSGNRKHDYLVLKSNSNKFKFFDQKNSAIGGRFDFSEFKKKVIEYFKLPEFDKELGAIDFAHIHRSKSTKREPISTAYEYLLSIAQCDFIDSHIKSKSEPWNDVVWLTENQLISKSNNWETNQKFIFNHEKPFQAPNISNDLRANLKNIVNAKENGKLVIFAGAGVSIESGITDWAGLTKELKKDINSEETDFQKLGQLYVDIKGENEFNNKIREVLKYEKTQYNLVHELIVNLQPLHVITTNYDDHFEQVLKDKSFKYSIVKKDSDLPYSKGTSMLIKMHGDLAERNIVFTTSDYTNYSDNFPLVERFSQGIFASKLVLFIGFSFTDPNLEKILNSVKKILKRDNPKPYLITIPKLNNSGQKNKQYLKNKSRLEEKGVRVVEYEEGIEGYIGQIVPESDPDFQKVKEYSLTGKKVYNFLKVIENFDPFSDALDNMDIENQFISSLQRFQGLGSVPPEVFSSISPFRLKKSVEWELSGDATLSRYSPFHLETLNETLLNFLHEKSDSNNKVHFKSYMDSNIPKSEQSLDSTFKLLFSSSVKTILRKNDSSPDYFDLTPIKPTEPCDCYRCLTDFFDTNEALKRLNTFSVAAMCSQKENVRLFEAYGFQKTGQFARSFFILEELKNLSWKRHDYIMFFLANYNQKLLYPFTWWIEDRSIEEVEFEQIRDKISNIDLNKIINELPVDPIVKEALIIIKENKLLHNARTILDEEFSKIKKLYKKYKKGGYFSSGSNHWYMAEVTFYNLWNFYHKNLIFNDEYDNFKDLAKTYIESIIASYCTSHEYRQRIKYCSPFFTFILIHYGDPAHLKQTFEQYEVNLIELENQKKSVTDIIESFTNFCKSGYIENNVVRQEIVVNPVYQSAMDNSIIFEERQRKIFNNFLFLLTKIKLNRTQVNQTIDLALNYLSVSTTFEFPDSVGHFTKYAVHHIEKIDNENTDRLIHYMLSDNIWPDKLIEPICHAIINKQKREEFLDEKVYLKIMRRAEKRTKWNVKLEVMIPFFWLLKKGQRKLFLNEIRPSLLENNPLANKAYHWEIWEPKKDSDILDSFVRILLEKSKGFPDYHIRNNGLPEDIDNFSVWNDLIFIVYLIYNHNLFEEQFVKDLYENVNSKMFKWLFRPKEFDYKNFDLRWLLAFKGKIITNELKKVAKLKETIEKGLTESYDEKIAKTYFERFLKK